MQKFAVSTIWKIPLRVRRHSRSQLKLKRFGFAYLDCILFICYLFYYFTNLIQFYVVWSHVNFSSRRGGLGLRSTFPSTSSSEQRALGSRCGADVERHHHGSSLQSTKPPYRSPSKKQWQMRPSSRISGSLFTKTTLLLVKEMSCHNLILIAPSSSACQHLSLSSFSPIWLLFGLRPKILSRHWMAGLG